MKKFLRPRTVLAAVLFALLAFLLGAVLWNRGHARYEALPEADRFMLDEWNTYHQGTADQDLWEGFQLQERSILALNGSSGVGYLIQPSQPVRNPLAAKLAMPDYMQDGWPAGSTYSMEGLSADGRELLYQEYEVLADLQNALLAGRTDRSALLAYTQQYLDIVAQRIQRDPAFLEQELARETVEGTATYVGIRASQLTGYDFGVMYFDNVKDVPFSDLRNTVESGRLDAQVLANRIPYETGALLCLLLDRLEVPDWQAELNRQTPEQPVTLYDVLRAACQPDAL